MTGSAPINLIYSVKEVSDEDIDYFLSSFEIRDKKLRQNYLSVKETLMGLSYRFSHYNPLDRDNYKKQQVDLLLLKWENWFIKAVESSKGVKELKALYLKKAVRSLRASSSEFKKKGIDIWIPKFTLSNRSQ